MKRTNHFSQTLLSLSLLTLCACSSGNVPAQTSQPGASPAPTSAPTAAPPSTPAPSAAPTSEPTSAPSAAPTALPTAAPTAAPTAEPVLLDNLTGVWKGGSNGRYYLRQSGETVVWYGEAQATSPDWAQVAIGKRNSDNQLVMDWYDVPKGASSGIGKLSADIMPENKLSEATHTGSLNESDWTLQTSAPSYPIIQQSSALLLVAPQADLTGVWKDLSGARFYLTQHNNKLIGYAESSPNNPNWSAVIYGSVSGSKVYLTWAGLPKSTQPDFSLSSGRHTMNISSVNMLSLVEESVQGKALGMSKWGRVQ